MDTNNDTSEQSSESESSCKHLMYKTVGGYSEPDSGFKVCILPLQTPLEVRDKVQRFKLLPPKAPSAGIFILPLSFYGITELTQETLGIFDFISDWSRLPSLTRI